MNRRKLMRAGHLVAVDPTRLRFGPYAPPPVKKGDRAFCLYRDADVVVTSWTDARLPWPRCRALHSRGGSGLLVTTELQRAILSESAAALKHWLGVGCNAVWNWRRAFGVCGLGTPGSRQVRVELNREIAETLRDEEHSPAAGERRRRSALALDLGRNFLRRWEGKTWTAELGALLGTVPDAELAVRWGGTERAVRIRRTRLGIPTYQDRRKGRPKHGPLKDRITPGHATTQWTAPEERPK